MNAIHKNLYKVSIAVAMIFVAVAANATTISLTTDGASGFINGAFFQQIDAQATGTGVINTFVRIHKSPTEQGYNTSGRPLKFDEDTSLLVTHDLQLSSVPTVTVDGNVYRQFLLDLNEPGQATGSLITLDSLQVYLGPVGGLTPDTLSLLSSLGTKIYDLDGIEASSIELKASLNSGSGSGDMYAYILDNLFTGPSTQYVYLYSAFGVPNTSDGGFEEWAVVGQPTPPVPEPGTLLLLGCGLFGLAIFSKRRMKA